MTLAVEQKVADRNGGTEASSRGMQFTERPGGFLFEDSGSRSEPQKEPLALRCFKML